MEYGGTSTGLAFSGNNLFQYTSSSKTRREQLEERKKLNLQEIERHTQENLDIDKAIALIDSNPVMETLEQLWISIFKRSF